MLSISKFDRSSVLLAVVFFLVLGSIAACSDRTQQEIADIISSSPRLRRADQICAEIPKPGGFAFVGKDLFANSEYGAVTFQYSSGLTASDVAAYFKSALPSRKWELVAEWPEEERVRLYLKFQQGQEFVSIERIGPGTVNFIINCGVVADR